MTVLSLFVCLFGWALSVRRLLVAGTEDQNVGKHMNLRMLLPIFCLIGLFVGLLMMLSPLFLTGGYVGSQKSEPQGGVQILFDIAMSVIMGIAVMIGSGICAVILGVVFGIEAGANRSSQPQVHGQRPASGPEVSRKLEEVDNHGLSEHLQNDEQTH